MSECIIKEVAQKRNLIRQATIKRQIRQRWKRAGKPASWIDPTIQVESGMEGSAKRRRAANVLLANLAKTYRLRSALIVPLNKQHYRPGGFLHGISYGSIRDILETLKGNGIIIFEQRGFFDTTSPGNCKTSRFLADPRIMAYGTPRKDNPEMKLRGKTENGRKIDLPVPDNAFTQELRERIRAVNAYNVRHLFTAVDGLMELDVGYGWKRLPVDPAIGARFNIDDQMDTQESRKDPKTWKGGRMYTTGDSFQNLSKRGRLNIEIDGHPVVETDFKALHCFMAYALLADRQWPFERDPYVLPFKDVIEPARGEIPSNHDEVRAWAKLIWQTALNAESPRQFVQACCYSIKRDRNFRWTYKRWFKPRGIRPMHFYKRLQAAHPDLQPWFCSGVGLALQRRDSEIALEIVERMQAAEEPCLCVHDSFLVRMDARELLESTMTRVYRDHCNGFEIPFETAIKRSLKHHLPESPKARK